MKPRRRGRRSPLALGWAGATLAAVALTAPSGSAQSAEPQPAAEQAPDLAAARALFERNLESIRRRDAGAYLACYLQSPLLVRTGPPGFSLGYDEVARTTGENWPDVFDAQDLRLTWLAPGWVYGTYRYRVRYLDEEGGDDEQIGLSERLFRRTPDGWKIAASTAFPSPPGTPPPARALVGATLVDGSGAPPVADSVVVLRDAKIECAGPRSSCPVPEGIEVTDLSGLWLTPGLIDAHVHFAQTGWADGRPDALDVRERYPYEAAIAELRDHPEKLFRALLCSGVTTAFDVGGYPWTLRLGERAALDRRAPRVAAAGPLLSTLDHWVNLPGERQFVHLTDEAAARSGARYLASQGSAAAKVWFIVTGERPLATTEVAVRAAGEEARRLGLPLIVHATGLAEAKAAVRAGAQLLVHSVWDDPVDEEFLRLAREAGTIYCPTLTVARGYVRLFEAAAAGRAPQVDDPHGCVHPSVLARVAATAELGAKALPPERLTALSTRVSEEERTAAENLRRVRDAGIPIALGTDAGNPLTLHGPSVYAEAEAMQAAGMSAMEVLVAATRGGARAMGREKDLGTIEAGKAADLLVLAADPTADARHLRQLRWVINGGELRPVTELRQSPAKPAVK